MGGAPMTGAWLIDGFPDRDAYDTATAEDITLGRFACGMCADNRDAAERAELEIRRVQRKLARLERIIAATRAQIAQAATRAQIGGKI